MDQLPQVHSIIILILMEKLNICREVNFEKSANFLREFHNEFNGKKDIALKNGINIHTKNDYLCAKDLSATLLNYVEKAYPNFPKYIIEICKKTGRVLIIVGALIRDLMDKPS